MSKPTTEDLGELLGAVTATLIEAVAVQDVETEKGGVQRVLPAPAFLAAAITLLKNNNITADVSRNESLAKLNEQLAERGRARKRATTRPGVGDEVVQREIDRLHAQWQEEGGSLQ
jgi:hypothetical protein